MKKLEPVLTEKSLSDAKKGVYTFRVSRDLGKFKIKDLVEKTFDVGVKSVRTMNEAGAVKRNILGKKRVEMPTKKAKVTLNEKDKIDLFETKG